MIKLSVVLVCTTYAEALDDFKVPIGPSTIDGIIIVASFSGLYHFSCYLCSIIIEEEAFAASNRVSTSSLA